MKRIKITKRDFENKLVKEFGLTGLVASPYIEDGKKLTLYYLEDIKEYPLHIATWMSGEGWVFDHAEEYKLENTLTSP